MNKNRFGAFTAIFFALLVAACSKNQDQGDKSTAPAAPQITLTAPTGNDIESWKAYFKQEVTPYIDKRYRRPYTYYIPAVDSAAPDAAEQQRQYEAQLENVQNTVGRGIQAGAMVAFGGPDSKGVVEVIKTAFSLAAPKSLKGVRIVVIAKAEDKAAIEQMIAPTEAEFIFLEPK